MKKNKAIKYRYYEFEQNGEKCVAAVSSYAGRKVRAVARCSKSDAYDFEKGKKLAAARCDLKIREKRIKRSWNKRHEAAIALERATKQWDKMNKYYSDSLEECIVSQKYLKILEESM